MKRGEAMISGMDIGCCWPAGYLLLQSMYQKEEVGLGRMRGTRGTRGMKMQLINPDQDF
jgi:hypothetical protein